MAFLGLLLRLTAEDSSLIFRVTPIDHIAPQTQSRFEFFLKEEDVLDLQVGNPTTTGSQQGYRAYCLNTGLI